MTKSIILSLLLTSVIFSQDLRISGKVYNYETKEAIPFVNIRVDKTAQGTSSNKEGAFVIMLHSPKAKLIFTAVGFKKKEIEIDDSKSALKIELKPEPIQFMEIVVGSDEDPAYRIVREAIKRKDQNRAGLKSLQYDLFSKDIFLSDRKVAMVSEKFSTGYMQHDKPEKIIAHSVFISENEKKNALSFDQNVLDKMYVDFEDDELVIVGNKVFLPLAKNAFDWYDYKLLEVKQSGLVHECYIEVIPKSKIQPLLSGKIVIEDSTYSLINVQLKNSEGLRFPYVNDLSIVFIQNRNRFNNYWLPTYFNVESGLKLNFQGLIGTGAISMNQVSMFTNYKINPVISDSIYNIFSITTNDSSKDKKIRFVKAEILDRVQIDSLRPIPLTSAEVNAYNELDSTKKILTQIKFTGVFGGVAQEAVNKEAGTNAKSEFMEYVGKIFSVLSVRDNRVDGILIGAHYGDSFFNNTFSCRAGLGYAFGRKNLEWRANVGFQPKNSLVNSIELEFYDEAIQWQMLNPYPDWLNTANVFWGFDDQFNYFRSRGLSVGIGNYFSSEISSDTKFIFEKQEQLPAQKYQSIFNTNRVVRSNPIIAVGNDNRISIDIQIGKNPNQYQPMASDGLLAQLGFSNPIFGSNFNYKRVRLISQISAKTFYGELFSSPYFLLGMEGGFIVGDFGPQHILTPNTALNIYSPFLSFKALMPYQFVGDKMLAVHAEHNWRTIPFQAIGFSFLSDLYIDVITGGAALKLWNTTSYLTSNSQTEIYGEVYLSFARIFGIGRIDFAYSSQRNFVVRVGLSAVL